MPPRRLTGLAGNFFSGVRLARASLVRIALPIVAAMLFASQAIGANNVVEYTYDALGNITQIQRQTTPGLALTSFSPLSGPVGAAVTIYGAGFSATPTNNTVQFSGTASTVTASDSGSIATTVPSGATTGRISVTVGGNTVTSAQDFTVTVAGAPTITSFTPATGAAGTTISVAGTAFDPATNATTVKLNGVVATASVTSDTALTFTVPGAAASGRITATTAIGTGASSSDFIVPPPGINAADIVAAVRLTVNGANSNISVPIYNKSAVALFDAAANGYYSLQFNTFATSPTNASIPYKIIAPDNTVFSSGSLTMSGVQTIHIPKLISAGTYSLLLSPGAATLNTNVRVAADPVLTIDGASGASSLDFAYQSARFLVDATANQRIGVGILGIAVSPSTSTQSPSFKVAQSDGTTVLNATCNMGQSANPQNNCDVEFVAPTAGTYTLTLDHGVGYYSNASVQVSSYVTGTLTADVGQSVNLARVGQDAIYTFAGTVGDNVGIDISAVTPLPKAQAMNVVVAKPNGSIVVSCSPTPPANIYCDAGTLDTTGTYTVTVDPAYGGYGTFKLTLKQGPSLVVGDTATSFAPADVPETARFRFTGAAGQTLTIAIANLAYVGTSSSATTVAGFGTNVTGTSVQCNPTSWSCLLILSNLTASTYSIAIEPPAGVKVTGNIQLSAEVTGTLTAGTPQTVSANRAGQQAHYTFSGTAGDSTSVKLFGVVTTPAAQNLTVFVKNPNGSILSSSAIGSGSSTIVNLASLPSTGTYTVLVTPATASTWQGQLELDAGTLISVNTETPTLANSLAGEPLRYRFSGTSGQRLEFGLTGLTYGASSANSTNVNVSRPDGSQLLNVACATSGVGACEAFSTSLPNTGTYSIVFSPPSASSITGGTFALSTPATGTLVTGDPAQTISIARAGQTARYTFSGTAAQLLRLNWSSVTVASGATVSVSVLKPDGTTLTSGSFVNGASSGVDIASLPSSGTYTVVLDPSLAATMSASIALVTR